MKKNNDFNSLTLKSKDSIFLALKKLNGGPFRFQIVVDNNMNLLGTLTDGDVRRGLLKGLDLNDEVKRFMNKRPIFSNQANPQKNAVKLMSVKLLNKFLPVTDKNNKFRYVLLNEYTLSNKTALIMAGGFGKRLGSRTKNIPKPLLKINNEPIIESLLKQLEKSNYETIYISVHYLYKKIDDYIKKRKSESNIQLIVEDNPLGTAGSINLIPKNKYDTLTVVNGDVLTGVSFEALDEFHEERKNDITITIARYDYRVPFGVVDLEKNYNLKEIKEKPIFSHYILSGIYRMNKNICELVGNRNVDMPEILQSAHNMGKKIGAFPLYEYWKDLGNPDDFKIAKTKNINTEKQ